MPKDSTDIMLKGKESFSIKSLHADLDALLTQKLIHSGDSEGLLKVQTHFLEVQSKMKYSNTALEAIESSSLPYQLPLSEKRIRDYRVTTAVPLKSLHQNSV